MLSFLRLSFLPTSADLGLLLLRATAGGSMLWLHGKDKLLKFEETKFFNIVMNSKVSLGLATFAEVVCAILLVVGLFTRFAALALAITMGVAVVKVHEMKLTGGGELAMLYLAAFVTIFLTGAGKFSADGNMGGGGGKEH